LEKPSPYDHLVPLRILLPLVVGVGPELVGGDAEFEHRLAALQCLLLWGAANEARDNDLVNSLEDPSFCPLLGREKSEWRLLPNQATAFCGGPKEFVT
jgi:hypothetical protein